MMPESSSVVEDFEWLTKLDEQIARAVAAARCFFCSGPLHFANYLRKPRGAAIATAGEAFALRYSLCCGRTGCRKRTLPPSLRFLGRRVYLEIVVVAASLLAQAAARLRAVRQATQVPEWTLKRWLSWWQADLPRQGWWAQLRSRLVPPPPREADLPRSLVDKLAHAAGTAAPSWRLVARCLAPGTTRSPIDAARFVRAIAGA